MVKFLFLILIVVFSSADITYILNLLSQIENRKYNFEELKIPKIVYKKIITNKKKSEENREVNLVVGAVFNNMALIYNKWYKVGDMYEDYKIVKITSDVIVLKNNEKLYTINIKPKIGF